MKCPKCGAEIGEQDRILVRTKDLAGLLSCGVDRAAVIGTKAGAHVVQGNRNYWNLAKIRKYIDEVSNGSSCQD